MARRGRPRLAGFRFGVIAALLALSLFPLGCSGSHKANNAGGQRPPEMVVVTPQATAAAVTVAAATPATASSTPTPTPTASPTASPTPESSATPTPTPVPRVETLADGTHGYIVTGGAVVQAEPNTRSAVVARLGFEQQLNLKARVRGENVVVASQTWYIAPQDWQTLWYQVDGGYVYSAYVWTPRTGETLTSQLPRGERWVNVNLATQTAQAMIGDTAVYTAPVTSGKDGYETPTGHWRVGYQVLNETMTSGQAGINDPAEHYDVHNVLFTQYFDGDGDALHLNYWQPDGVFGNTRTSHGCVGLYIRDAQYLWMFGQAGMRVEITSNGRILPRPNPPPQPVATATPTPAPRRVATPAPPAATPEVEPLETPTPRPPAPRPVATPQPPRLTAPTGTPAVALPPFTVTPAPAAPTPTPAVNQNLPPQIQAALQATPAPAPR